MKLTVIIPCHDSDKFLSNIIYDLNNQTYRDFNVVFVDDNSVVPVEDILKEIIITFQYKVVHTIAGTPGGSRNAGIPYITGTYCCFIDSDDRISSNMLEYHLKTIENYPDLLPLSRKNVVKFGNKFSIESLPYLTHKKDLSDIWLLGRTIFKSDVIKKYTLQFSEISHAEDLLFISEYMTFAKITGIVKHTGNFYRIIRPDSVCSLNDRYVKAIPIFLEKLNKWIDLKFNQIFIDVLVNLISSTYKNI